MLHAIAVLVVLLALLGTVNLALVLRLGKLFREHVDQAPAGPQPAAFPVGAPLPQFAVTTADGDPVTDADLRTGTVLLAFLSTTCAPCHAGLPKLRETAGALARVHGGRTVAVVASPPHVDHARMLAGLPAEADVVTGHDYRTPAHTAFGVTAYPTYLLFTDGVAVSVTTDAEHIRLPVPA